MSAESLKCVEVASVSELREWLDAHHGQDESIWLVTYKKAAGDRYVSRDAVLDELLCVGWIDGARRKMDDLRTMQLVGPRRVLHWSASYKRRAERLTAEGRMRPAGQAAIDASKAAGEWTRLDNVDALVIADDVAAALSKSPGARAGFEAFPDSTKRFTLRWIELAKRPETRARRIEQAASLAAKGQKVSGA
ncbi:MAG: YdeI/OmpD-associated family protein [Bacteroidota bacterium]